VSVVVAGEEAIILQCRLSPAFLIKWYFETETLVPLLIYDGQMEVHSDRFKSYDVKFTDVRGISLSVMTIWNVQLEHAGLLQCLDMTNNSFRAEQELVVLGEYS